MAVGIVATISPRTIHLIDKLIEHGVSIWRLNGSFRIPKNLDKLKKTKIPILLDIPGNRKKKTTRTKTDEELIEFALENTLDYIGLSYVTCKDDVTKCRKKIDDIRASKNMLNDLKIIAKIETKEALMNLEEIIPVSDMLLIDRGDLGTAIGWEKVPAHQKIVLYYANLHKIKCIVATEMMMSTIVNEKPSVADVSDVFYALIDGADYVMLSEETAINPNAVRSVQMMKKIITYYEGDGEVI